MQRKLYTTKDLFDATIRQLQDEEKIPATVDYALPASPVPLRYYGFDVLGCVNYGANEGIYVDLYYRGDIGDGTCKQGNIGTIKTLYTDAGTFRNMAVLMADFQINATKFINANLDDFTHIGYDAHFYFDGDEEKHPRYGYTERRSKSLEEAKDDARRYLCMNEPYDYDYAIVMENATGKSVVIRREEVVPENK